MFKIADGREHFYQWDLDRQITVEDDSITEVHFCNRTDECSLVVDVVDGLANVPNVILQKSFDVRLFAYDGKATRYDEVFKVKPRTKPADYVYTEVEIKNFENLEKQLDEKIDNRLDELIENGVKVDLEGYATEDYVDKAIEAIPEVNLEPYAKKEDIPDVSDFISEIPSEYITESELNAKGYATGGYVDSKIAGIVIPTVPTKVSAFENDKGYLTEHQSLEGYAKLSDIPDVSEFIKEIPSEYITDSELTEKGYLTERHLEEYAKKSDIPSTEGFATEAYVDKAIAAIEIGDVDLSNYYTKEETNTAIYNSKDAYYFDFREATKAYQPATEEMIEFATRFIEGQNVCAHVMTKQSGANPVKGYQPVTVQKMVGNNLRIITNGIDPANAADSHTSTYYEYYIRNDSTDGWVYHCSTTYSFALATKDYVDSLFEGIATAEGGAY